MKHDVIPKPNWADVKAALERLPLSPATRKDYASALNRGVEILQCNRLEDIPVDLSEFHRRFHRNKFSPALFKTEKAFRAWRRKVLAALKGFLGMFDGERARRGAEDEWSALLLTASSFVITKDGWSEPHLVPLHSLADEARLRGWTPKDITTDHLISVVNELPPNGRRKSIVRAAALLNRLRDMCPCIAEMLDPVAFEEVSRVRRRVTTAPPQLMAKALEWIEDFCLGEQDEIMETHENAKAEKTQATYEAAFKKFLGTANRLGLLEGTNSLADAFQRTTFNAVVREWILCSDPAEKISDRTKSKYVADIRRIVRRNGVDIEVMDKAFRTNRNLKLGIKAGYKMGLDEQQFCAWLLGNRAAEMLYRSLHIRFYDRCQTLLCAERENRLRPSDQVKILQLGAVAAMAAIEIWGPPLRIDNLRSIPIFGEMPWLFMPTGKRKHAMFVLPSAPTKMKRPIRQKLLPSRNRALEVLDWYIRTIRPRFPGATASIYLFPGYGKDGGPITAGCLRNWLKLHGRHEGIVMNPHYFRHAVASLYIRSHPNGFAHVAKLLDDHPDTVRKFYAWINDERVLEELQSEMLKLAGFGHDAE